MLSRALRAWGSAELRLRHRDAGIARRRAWRSGGRCRPCEMKPRSTSFCARSRLAWASSASARATSIWRQAAPRSASAPSDRSPRAPARADTQLPGSTSTRVTSPPSPATPTGISRRAASVPVAETTRSTIWRPGTATLTVGALPLAPASGAAGGTRPSESEPRAGDRRHRDDRADDPHPATTRPLLDEDRLTISGKIRFVVHCRSTPCHRPNPLRISRGQTVLAE